MIKWSPNSMRTLSVLVWFSVVCYWPILHDDVIKWKHFPRYWPRRPVNSPHKGQWCGALMFSMICAWINAWINNREAGDLRRHRAHYDVTVVTYIFSEWLIGTGAIVWLCEWSRPWEWGYICIINPIRSMDIFIKQRNEGQQLHVFILLGILWTWRIKMYMLGVYAPFKSLIHGRCGSNFECIKSPNICYRLNSWVLFLFPCECRRTPLTINKINQGDFMVLLRYKPLTDPYILFDRLDFVVVLSPLIFTIGSCSKLNSFFLFKFCWRCDIKNCTLDGCL